MKDPAVLFYTGDFLTGTFTMTDEQVGKYIRLLCLQHQKGSLSETDMLNICKTYDKEVYCKFVKNGSDFYNERMKNEADKRKKYSESRKANRESKPEKPLNKGKVKSKIISESYVNHMENENRNEIININEDKDKSVSNEITEKFETWYEKYPRKEAKQKAIESWKKHYNEMPDFQSMMLALAKQIRSAQWQKDNGQFIPMPSSYLNGKRWTDQIEDKPVKSLGCNPFDLIAQ